MNKKTKIVLTAALIGLAVMATSCTSMLLGLNLQGSTYKDSTGYVTLYFTNDASNSNALYKLDVTIAGVSTTFYWILNDDNNVEIYTDENGSKSSLVGTLEPDGVSAKTLTGTVKFASVAVEWTFTKQ